MAFARPHSIAADATFSNQGRDVWNANHTPTGADVGGIPYCPTATSETTSANLTYTETSGPRLQVGSGSTTLQGWILGQKATGQSGVWSTAVTPGASNYTLVDVGGDLYLNAYKTGGKITFLSNGANLASLFAAAGQGFTVSAGTATTDVNALSATQTMNAAAVAFTGWKGTFTEGASGTAAGTKLINLLYGTSGAESTQFAVSKTGLITTGGTDGVASFGPSIVTSITVKNGIITAIS